MTTATTTATTTTATTTQEPLSSEPKNGDIYITQSTLTLLEHVNLNVPNHDYSLDFYFKVLKCGMDPRKANNLRPNAPKKTLWANCGASQFHLPKADDGMAQVISGQVGLRYTSQTALEALKHRLETFPQCYESFESLQDGTCLHITDKYGNHFYARADVATADTTTNHERLAANWKQPVIYKSQVEQWGDIAIQYGLEDDDVDDDDNQTTCCRGIDYVEVHCPPHTAAAIAQFYDKLFDATTTVLPQTKLDNSDSSSNNNNNNDDNANNLQVAIVAFGRITPQGRADQSLIFRETTTTTTPQDVSYHHCHRHGPSYNGYHIALYVGETAEDFEQAYKACEMAGIVWINPRFDDKADSLFLACNKYRQFRFKDIVDLTTGKVILELEHEVRAIYHDAFPGK